MTTKTKTKTKDKATQQKSRQPSIKANEEKWGKTNMKAGWTAVPNALLVHQATLGLSPMDINIIMQISRFWWDAGNHPFPAKKTIADSIGVTPRAIQQRIASLEKAGFIERVERREKKGSKTNIYKLSPLKDILRPYSKEILKEKARRAKTDRDRPNLRVNMKFKRTKK